MLPQSIYPELELRWAYVQADPDFNSNSAYDVFDLDVLVTMVSQSTYGSDADLDYDGDVDESDRNLMIDVLDSVLGDVNGDGVFNSADLVALFTAGEYETNSIATYSQGDFNADGVFDSGDLVEVFEASTYSQGAEALLDDWESTFE